MLQLSLFDAISSFEKQKVVSAFFCLQDEHVIRVQTMQKQNLRCVSNNGNNPTHVVGVIMIFADSRLTLIELPLSLLCSAVIQLFVMRVCKKKNTDGKYVIRISVNNLCRAVAPQLQALFLCTFLRQNQELYHSLTKAKSPF